jgi:hypothetical protein
MVGGMKVLTRCSDTSIMRPSAKNKRTWFLDPIHRRVIVQCRGASCLGYLDTDGKWKSAYTKKVLPGVIDFSPIGDW